MGDFLNQPDFLAGVTMVAIVLAAVTFPLVFELLVLTTASLFPARRGSAPANQLRKLTIIVPAHNEGLLVERCVRSMVGQLGASTSLMVIAHNCVDDTAERARNAGAEVIRLDDPGQSGKACALRYGFAHALSGGAEAVAVVDADSVVSENFVETMQRALSSGAQAVQCCYRVLLPDGHAGASVTGIAFQGFNVVRPRGRDRLGLSVGIFGNGFGMRSEVLERGPYSADSLVEDLEYHIQLVAAGIRVRFLEAATVFGEMPQGSAGNRTQRARWEGGRLLMVRAYLHRLPREIIKGHFRLIEPLLDILTMPTSMGVLALLLALCVPSEWLRWYAVVGLAILVYHFVTAVKAGPDFWGGIKVLAMAPRYIIWKLLLMPKIVWNSRRNASWVRTQRDKPADFSSRPHPDGLE
jgi:cellulose synthase/poly-beta-1,6-N-acetylglucosamine synthase-like glycosyltransferase